MTGRPSKFTQELADKICETIATSSKGLRAICAENKIDVSSLMKWLKENKEFSEQYARAKELQADYLVEEILEIVDDGSNDFMTITKGNESYNVEDREVTSRSKIRYDARKWIASKLAPKKYGDKTQTEHSGVVGVQQITGMIVK
jgi:hypothetical protein